MLTLQLTPLHPPPEKKTLPFLTGDRPCAYLAADPIPPPPPPPKRKTLTRTSDRPCAYLVAVPLPSPLKLEAPGFPQVLHSKTEGQWITKATVQWPS